MAVGYDGEKRRMGTKRITALFAGGMLLSACVPGQGVNLSAIPIVGAVIGGGACAAFYRGQNQALVASLCAVAGGLVGLGLRQYLDEQERLQLADATRRTLNTGVRQTVVTDKGTRIETEVIARPGAAQATRPTTRPASQQSTGRRPPATPGQSTAVAAGPPTEGTCETVRQRIRTVSNQEHTETVTSCWRNGVWEAA